MAKALLQKLVGILSICVLAVSGLATYAPAPKVAAADCDANAVIYCGVTGLSDLVKKYRQNQNGNVHEIFAHFGIPNESYMDGMVMGRVTKTNEVWVGDEVVAKGALTAGRQYMQGSDKIPGVDAYMRQPSVSFRSSSLPALVKMKNGRFQFAVIMSCGNPVNAFPVEKPAPKPQPKPKPAPKPPAKKPDMTIEKYVRVSGETNWEKSITADPGETLEYRILVKNIGETSLSDIVVQDSLPEGVSFEDATLSGTASAKEYMISDLVGSGANLDHMASGYTWEIEFSVVIGDETEACQVPMKNTAFAKAKEVSEQKDEVLTMVCQPEEPEPVVKAAKTPPPPQKMPDTGITGAFAFFSITSLLGAVTYKLKDFYAFFLR